MLDVRTHAIKEPDCQDVVGVMNHVASYPGLLDVFVAQACLLLTLLLHS
jgi:hypothetical protein